MRKLYSQIQRDTQRSKALVHITSPQNHHVCQSIWSIGIPTHRKRHRINQRQGCGATSRKLAELRHEFWNADLTGASSTVRRYLNPLVRYPSCISDIPIPPTENIVQNYALMEPYAVRSCRSTKWHLSRAVPDVSCELYFQPIQRGWLNNSIYSRSTGEEINQQHTLEVPKDYWHQFVRGWRCFELRLRWHVMHPRFVSCNGMVQDQKAPNLNRINCWRNDPIHMALFSSVRCRDTQRKQVFLSFIEDIVFTANGMLSSCAISLIWMQL